MTTALRARLDRHPRHCSEQRPASSPKAPLQVQRDCSRLTGSQGGMLGCRLPTCRLTRRLAAHPSQRLPSYSTGQHPVLAGAEPPGRRMAKRPRPRCPAATTGPWVSRQTDRGRAAGLGCRPGWASWAAEAASPTARPQGAAFPRDPPSSRAPRHWRSPPVAHRRPLPSLLRWMRRLSLHHLADSLRPDLSHCFPAPLDPARPLPTDRRPAAPDQGLLGPLPACPVCPVSPLDRTG